MSAVGIQFSHALSALNHTTQTIPQRLNVKEHIFTQNKELLNRSVWVGAYTGALVQDIPKELMIFDSRNLRFAMSALQPIKVQLDQLTAGINKQRLAVILGTSTSGIADNQALLHQNYTVAQSMLDEYRINYDRQVMSALAYGVQQYLGWEGIAYSISTACSSSAKAIAAGQRLLQADLADVVLVGGVDTLCPLTLQGFDSLESLSQTVCQPFGAKRDGINIGEAAALFVLTRDRADTMLLASGDAMDAWHISAPHPEGVGAFHAMQRALLAADIHLNDIDYINLHGTATPQNDAMEYRAIHKLQQYFETEYQPFVSSTKHKTGHCLGAAGAIEAYICQQLLRSENIWLPQHHNGTIDESLAHLNYVTADTKPNKVNYVMSNSFAFGGSNSCLVFGRG